MNRQDEKIVTRRYKAINELLVKYPDGMQIKNLLDEYSDIFENQTQAFRFVADLEEQNKLTHVRRNHRQHYYTENVDTYKILTDLWQQTNI